MKLWGLFHVTKFRVFWIGLLSVALVFFGSTFSQAVRPRIAIIYDIGGRGDRSINDATAAGIDAAKAKFQLSALDLREMVTDGSESDRESRLRFLAKAGYNLIIVVGSAFSQALQTVGQEFPNSQFAVINDQSVPLVNVSSVVFAENQGAYLAGITAALVSKTGRIGFVANPNSLNNARNLASYVAGAKFAKPSVKVISANIGKYPTEFVSDLVIAKADIIYSTWSVTHEIIQGIVLADHKSLKVRMIGVLPDQYFLNSFIGSKYLLTTVDKNVPVAVLDLVKTALTGRTLSDILDSNIGIYGHRYGLAEKAIEFPHESATTIAEGVQKKAIALILSGKIKLPA